MFVLAGAMRLARFNVASEETGDGWFTGVPITAAGGGLVASFILVLIHNGDVAISLPLHLYLPVMMFVLALFMISRVRFPKAKLRDNKIVNVFQVIVISVVYYCGITRTNPEYLFAIGIMLLVGGIIAGRITARNDSAAT